MIQHLGCMPSPALLSIASGSDSQVIVAGISPNIAPRVANRVIGFTGPLTVRPLPDWGVIGVGEVGVEVVKKALATRSSVGIAEIRVGIAGIRIQPLVAIFPGESLYMPPKFLFQDFLVRVPHKEKELEQQ